MREVIRYTIVLFLTLGLLAVLTPSLTVKAQPEMVNPVLVPGDSFTYGTPNGSPWVWMDPAGAQPMQQWEPFVNMSTITFTIGQNWELDAPHSEIMFNETFTYRNGTVINWTGQTVDLSTGQGIGKSWFIAPGLVSNDNIYPGNSSSQTVNYTSTSSPFWPGREVCILNVTAGVPLESSSSEMAAEQTTFVWDRASGALLAGYEQAVAVNPQNNGEVEGGILYELISNNVGIPMQYPGNANMTTTYVVIAIIVIGVIILIGVVAVRVTAKGSKKKHKRLNER